MFADVVKIFTKYGESKAGLPTHCIQLRYSSKVFVEMMKRVLEFDYPDAGTKLEFKEEVADIFKE